MIPTAKVGPALKAFLNFSIQVNQAVLLEGPAGVGKTEIVQEVARENKLECLVLNLSILEPTDLTGLPVTVGGKTQYAQPVLLPSAKEGVLFVDEINRSDKSMQNPLLQLITLKRLNNYVLPAGQRIIAACNPDQDDAYHTQELDLALKSRFVRVRVEPDERLWADWARKNGVHHFVVEFVRATPKLFDSEYSNPRAWFCISKALQQYEAGMCPYEVFQLTVQGRVGATLSKAFLQMLRKPHAVLPPKPEEVLRNYRRVRGRVKALAQAGQTSQLHSLTCQVLALLQDPDCESKVRASTKALGNLRALRSDLPAEYRRKIDQHLPWLKNGGKPR